MFTPVYGLDSCIEKVCLGGEEACLPASSVNSLVPENETTREKENFWLVLVLFPFSVLSYYVGLLILIVVWIKGYRVKFKLNYFKMSL